MKLTEIDLSRCCEKEGALRDSGSSLQTINHRATTLVNFQNNGTDTASMVGGGGGLQLDKPGTNMSSWMRLWLIEPEI